MANTYFNYTDPVEPGDRLESTKYNGDFSAIARAFDILPSPDALASNTGNYVRSQGTATAYTATLPNFDGSFGYLTGMQVLLNIHVNNTGAATLNVNGLGAKALVNLTTASGPLVANDLRAGTIYSIRYDGTRFQVVNTVSSAITSAQVSADNASAAAAAAAASATSAANSASSATTQAANAANSATAAANSASSAAASATAAAASATASGTSATNAANSATAAAGSASTATTQATTATTRATAAAASATAAATSATNAANSSTAAANSSTAAANSATNAANSLSDAAFRAAVLAVVIPNAAPIGTVKWYASNVNPNNLYSGTTWVRLPASQSIRTALADASNVMTTVGADSVTLAVANLPAHNHTGTATIANTDLGTKTSAAYDYGTKTSTGYNYGEISVSNNDLGSKTATSTDLGTKVVAGAGAHSHTISLGNNANVTSGRGSASSSGQTGVMYTNEVPDHYHNVVLGSHNHSVVLGSHNHTVNLGSHSHSVAIGSHSHTVAVGSHNHTVTMSIGNTGTGQAFAIVAKSLILVGWRRTA